ncbi:signal recognition particle-docking protein FtsY [Pseudomonas sp. M47T1]|uniref:signal recognition particle-docking protein FtsY n=1 Tax=Pseudomonas sp. M47T1 TaxID=1179778 RepID=UPI0002607A57|nr:signal recognition particle-docking protein FtsY [Pseudomonas sp. M47T1]EIK98533.1 signal recognition particle-docking protein FtsY [Pseudomonas sp. M47T1]
MFGSNDDKKSPEKKGLFGWLRKKPAQEAVEQPQAPESVAPETIVELAPEPVLAPVVAEPVAEVAAAPAGLVLPVPEEPVALVPDHLEPHEPPPIAPLPEAVVPEPAVEPVVAQAVVEPVVVVEPVAPEPIVFEPQPQPQPQPAAVPVSEPVAVAAPTPAVEPEPAPVAVAPAAVLVAELQPEPAPEAEPESVAQAEASKVGFFARLKQGLAKTSASLGEGMASLFMGKKAIDDDLLEEIETRLLTADVGVEATSVIVQSLTQKVARKQLADSDALYKSLQGELTDLLRPVEQPLKITSQSKPFVILVVGVNGAGKTTTIGKLAKKLQLEGKKVMLAAGDTFRAAAVEQLQVWGERNKIPVIAQHTGADSASVIFDAVQAAKARGIDVLIADTAGRLHTKDNLMEELKKVRRVIGKLDADAPHEVLLVLDAGTGQNAINQAKQFNNTVALTGLALTKLDGTAKGGVIFALAKQFGLPIRYIGVGEGIDDLRTFEAEPFVQALFAERERS